MTNSSTYSELIKLATFEERFEYLKLNGVVSKLTFGSERYLNQMFYTSDEWRKLRNKIILRDNGCDLGIEGFDIRIKIFIHHMNPITDEAILRHSKYLIDPEYLICVSMRTHNAIHYGDISQVSSTPIERKPFDTCPWRR